MRRSGPPDRGTRQTTPCRAVSSSAPQQAEAGVGIKQVHHRFLNPKADSLTFLRPRTCWNKNVQPTAAEVCRKHGISPASFYRLKAKYGGMDVSDARRVQPLVFRRILC